MDDPQEVRELLVKHGLAEKADVLMALVRPSIRIFTQPADDAELPVGVSKIGGEPDLPPGFEWPMWEHEPPKWYPQYTEKIRPLGFLAQFNLSEIAPYDLEHLLPPNGMLYFFYDGLEQPWYVGAKDGSAQVYYYDGNDVRRTSNPENLPIESRFKPCSVTFKAELTLPSVYSSHVERKYLYNDYPNAIHLSKVEAEGYDAVEDILYEATRTKGAITHRLLGYAQPVQFDVEPQGHLLLLQLDSNDDAGMMWGDVGKLYFWLSEEALATRRFNEWVMELQGS